MITRWDVERAFIECGWELLLKDDERTVLTKEEDEVYVTNEELQGPSSEYADVTMKLSDIENIDECGNFEVKNAIVRVRP